VIGSHERVGKVGPDKHVEGIKDIHGIAAWEAIY
jgi:hypothetical protein